LKLAKSVFFRQNFNVTAAAVDRLFVFDAKLQNQSFAVVVERFIHFAANFVKFGILRRLNTFVGFSVAVEFAVSQFQFAIIAFGFRLNPSFRPCVAIIEFFFDVDFSENDRNQR
jgi:hypothetical protein